MPTTLLLRSLPSDPILLAIDLRPLPHPCTPLTHIPPGWHFIYSSTTPSSSLRSGFWFRAPSELETSLVVLMWDSKREELVPASDGQNVVSTFHLEKIQDEIEYAHIAGKDTDVFWHQLTSHLSASLLNRFTRSTSIITTMSTSAQDTEIIPGLPISPIVPELMFLGIDLVHTWPEGAVGRERTEGARDRSWALGELVRKCRHDESRRDQEKDIEKEEDWGREVLGEVQVCFLMALTTSVGNWACGEEWRRVLTLLLTCRAVVAEREGFFIETFKVLSQQLQWLAQSDGSQDEDGEMLGVREGWLEGLLRGFARGLEEAFEEDEGKGLRKKMEELRKWVEEQWGWDIGGERGLKRSEIVFLEDGEMVELEMEKDEEEEGEYAPTVVEMG